MCLRTNTPGDCNNNAAVLGSFRAARAVRPFVSRGHSLHYNPKDKAPGGDTQGHGGGGIVPHSMHTSLLLQTYRKHTLRRWPEFKKRERLTIRCAQMALLTWCVEKDRRKEEEEIEEDMRKKINLGLD